MEADRNPGLYVREPGGGFYARITLNGKRTWRSLDTDKIRRAQERLLDLQSGHTWQVSMRSDDKLHAAMAKVIEFRAMGESTGRSRRAPQAVIRKSWALPRSCFPTALSRPPLPWGSWRVFSYGYGQSRRKAIFEFLKRTFADAVENGTTAKNPLAGRADKM